MEQVLAPLAEGKHWTKNSILHARTSGRAGFADFARVEIALGIHKRDIAAAEGAAFAPRSRFSAQPGQSAIQLPYVELAISATKTYFCCGSGEKSTDPAVPRILGVPGDYRILLELPSLVNTWMRLAGAVADIDEPVFGNADGMTGT